MVKSNSVSIWSSLLRSFFTNLNYFELIRFLPDQGITLLFLSSSKCFFKASVPRIYPKYWPQLNWMQEE